MKKIVPFFCLALCACAAQPPPRIYENVVVIERYGPTENTPGVMYENVWLDRDINVFVAPVIDEDGKLRRKFIDQDMSRLFAGDGEIIKRGNTVLLRRFGNGGDAVLETVE